MIRKGNKGDWNAVISIVQSYPSHFALSAYNFIRADFLSLPSIVWEDHGEVQSFLIWSATSFELEIVWLATHPSATKRGFARKLALHIEEHATTQKVLLAKTATLDSVIPDSRFTGAAYSPAHTFFSDIGFSKNGILTGYWGPLNDCLIMIKHIGRDDGNRGGESQ